MLCVSEMGYAIARMAMLRGADVTLVTGKTNIAPPMFTKVIETVSAKDMFEAVTKNAEDMDFIIKAAAVADYTPSTVSAEKIKKSEEEMNISLEKTQDILKYLGEHKPEKQKICGFSMETENMLENSKKKLISKNVDMIAANNVKVEGAGFGVDTNVITFITKNDITELPIMSKEEVADKLLDKMLHF